MQIVADERVAPFVARQCGVYIPAPYTVMGLEKDGQIVAGVAFHHFTGCDVHVTVAGKGWTRGFLAEVGGYVFGTLGCIRMTALTEQERVIRIAKKLGGQIEGRLRNHFGPGRDAVVLGILKDDYPW